MAKAKVRKAGVTKKSASPKRNRKGIYARDRTPVTRLQEHGFKMEVVEGIERKVPNLVARIRTGGSPSTLMRQAFEAAGHPRCVRSSAGTRSSQGSRR